MIQNNEVSDKKRLFCEITNENIAVSKQFKQAKNKLRVIKTAFPKLFNFPAEIKSSKIKYIKPSFQTLKEEYEELAKRLSKSRKESIRMLPERNFDNKLHSFSKKDVRPSMWIGSHCIDLFIPNVRSSENAPEKVMRGLAIEIDGDCHNYESKMIKDERKLNQLAMLGIGTTHIKNWEFNEPSLKPFLVRLKSLKVLDSRERKRLWQKIYSFTLAIHLKDQEFFQIFKKSPSTVGGQNEAC